MFLLGNVCFGQLGKTAEGRYAFIARETVIFEDNFGVDSVGRFPSKWHVTSCDRHLSAGFPDQQYCSVQKDAGEPLLSIRKTAWYIQPDIAAKSYLRDSFVVEFDFKFDVSGCAELNFYPREATDTCQRVCLHVISNGQLRRTGFSKGAPNIPLGNYPLVFDVAIWHHFAVEYNKRSINVSIDNYRIATLPDCKFSPYALSLGCIAPVKYKHFKVTAGRRRANFNAILAGNKIMLQSVNFDVNSTVVKAEQVSFISQLSEFLKAHPQIKLEINGHTDSDGDTAANMRLSQERADAIKGQLVATGISSDRLITNGFGATRPLQPNTTKEGKANNRRVEFEKSLK